MEISSKKRIIVDGEDWIQPIKMEIEDMVDTNQKNSEDADFTKAITTTEIAKKLKSKISATKLYDILVREGIVEQSTKGHYTLKPKYENLGFHIKTIGLSCEMNRDIILHKSSSIKWRNTTNVVNSLNTVVERYKETNREDK